VLAVGGGEAAAVQAIHACSVRAAHARAADSNNGAEVDNVTFASITNQDYERTIQRTSARQGEQQSSEKECKERIERTRAQRLCADDDRRRASSIQAQN